MAIKVVTDACHACFPCWLRLGGIPEQYVRGGRSSGSDEFFQDPRGYGENDQ